jgi:non-specific serine/threonine protein kinase
MIGREADLADVVALVTGSHRLVTLTGRTGVGKTRLALEVLQAYRNLHLGPAAVVQLSVLVDAGLVLPELASRLVVPFPPGQGALDALAGGIGEDDLLLVLDNFEHVTEAAVSLGQLLERCSHLRVLVTSQTPLHLRAERVVHLDPLPAPSPGDSPVDIRTNPAVRLYCERAAAASRVFHFGPANGRAIAELCRRLEGLPLAIELAAVRAGTLPVSEILVRLDAAPFDLLRQPQPDAPPRHHDLRAAIAWTYALLAPDEQRMLRRLSVTTGVFDIDDAAALDDEPIMLTINRVTALAELRLVDLLPGTVPAQYSMPWSIQTFAREELELSGEADGQRRRHVVRAAERARKMAAGLESRDADRWGETAAEEESAQLHALEEGLGLGMVPECLRIVVGLSLHWRARGYHHAHRLLVDRALGLAAEHGDESSVHANALSQSVINGLPLLQPADRPVLHEHLQLGEHLARRSDDEESLLLALSAVVLASQYTGDFAWARAAAAEALDRLDDTRPRWLARFQAWAGMLANLEGDTVNALDLGLQALAYATRERDSRTIVVATILLRPLVADRPDLAHRIPSSAAALALAHANGFILFEAMLGPTATVEATTNGDVNAARMHCLDALVVARSFGASPVVAVTLLATVETLVLEGRYEAAAYFHGVVRNRLPGLEVGMIPPHRDAMARSTAELHRRLGSHGFDVAATKGSQLTLDEGVLEALDYMRSLAAADTPRPTEKASAAVLTPRQLETLRLVAEGLTNKEIALRLGITPKTVMHHLTVVFQELGVRTRTEAALWATANGIAS